MDIQSVPVQADTLRAEILERVGSREEWWSLPGAFYSDAAVYEAELEAIWRSGWLFVGHSCEASAPGDFLTYEVGPDPLLFIRGDDRVLRGFHNVCRHRGTRLCREASGSIAELECPYHGWTYRRDGALSSCKGMGGNVTLGETELQRVHVKELGGMIFASLAESPPEFGAASELLGPQLAPQGLEQAKVAKAVTYDVPVNWKLIWENNRECYHCTQNHPQYTLANFDHHNSDDTTDELRETLKAAQLRHDQALKSAGIEVSHSDTGMALFPDPETGRWYSADRTTLVEGYLTDSMDGALVSTLMGAYTEPDVGTLRVRTMPNCWMHASCDHAVSTSFAPIDKDNTRIIVRWLVAGDAVEGADYDLAKVMPFWQLTSEQDWELCEEAQRGVLSSGYRPGPLSRTKEYCLNAFLSWYCGALKDWAGKSK